MSIDNQAGDFSVAATPSRETSSRRSVVWSSDSSESLSNRSVSNHPSNASAPRKNIRRMQERVLAQTRNYLLRTKVVPVDRIAPLANEIVHSVMADQPTGKLDEQTWVQLAIASASDATVTLRETQSNQHRVNVVPPAHFRSMRPAVPVTSIAMLRARWWRDLVGSGLAPVRRATTNAIRG